MVTGVYVTQQDSLTKVPVLVVLVLDLVNNVMVLMSFNSVHPLPVLPLV